MVGHRDGFILVPIRHIENWNYEGEVHNIEVKKGTPSYTAMSYLTVHNCTYISFGFESSDQGQLDYLEKGNTVAQQQTAFRSCIDTGINPITSYIIGYPDEDMQSLYNTARFWVVNGIQCAPFFLTPYAGTRIYWENEERILAQYGGSKERFVEACGDATDFVVNLTKRFNDVELLGLRQLMATHDLERLREHAKRKRDRIVDPNPPKSEIQRMVEETSLGEPKK